MFFWQLPRDFLVLKNIGWDFKGREGFEEDGPGAQGSPHFLRGRGNKRIVDAELLCEKNRGRAIRWEQVHDVQQKIEYRLKE